MNDLLKSNLKILKLSATPHQQYNSVPGTPLEGAECQELLKHRSSQFSWKKISSSRASMSSCRPIMQPCLDNLDLPYADDSEAVTPNSEDICNFHIAQHYFMPPCNGGISGFIFEFFQCLIHRLFWCTCRSLVNKINK